MNSRNPNEKNTPPDVSPDTADILRELTDSIEDVFYVLDLKQRRTLYISPAYDRIYGRSRAELLEKPDAWLEVVHPDDRAELEKGFREVISGERDASRAVEYRVTRNDGAVRWLRHRAFMIRDESGAPVRIAGHASDVTAEKHATEALRETSQRLQVFFDAYPDVMFLIDRQGTFIDYMTSAETKLYAPPGEFLGKRVVDVLPPEVNAELEETIERMWSSGEPQLVDYWLEYPDGPRAHEAYMKPISRGWGAENSSREEYAIIIAREITDRKTVELELANARDELEERVARRTAELEASRAAAARTERLASIGTLAAGSAHEINNPLGSIIMAVDLALASKDDPDASRVISEALESIKSDARRAGLIVRSVLQFSRQEQPQKWLNDIGDIARRARDLTRQHAAEARIDVALIVAEDLPEAMVNPTELEQVFVNLINNAIDATAAAGRHDAVAVHVSRVDNRMLIEVRDRGEGIGSDSTGRIFDPFYTSRQQEGGTGLGLSVTHGIVHQHQGRINVDSRSGEGTAITVDIPIGNGREQE
jgi:PAS domain S-box-containing protein